MKILLAKIYFLAWCVLPLTAFAASVRVIFEKGTDILKSVIEFLWVLAFAVFIWGIVRFIAAAGNPEKRKSAKDFIVYGLVGVFVLLSFMGLIQIVKNTIFDGSSGEKFQVPSAPSAPSGGGSNEIYFYP